MANILGDAADKQGKDDRYSGNWLKSFIGNNNVAKWQNQALGGGNNSSAGGATAGDSGPVAPANIVFGGQRAMSRANENYRDQLRIHREEVLEPHYTRTQEAADNDVVRGEVRAAGTHARNMERIGIEHKYREQGKNNDLVRSETVTNNAFVRQQPPAAAVARNRARTTTGTDRATRVAPAVKPPTTAQKNKQAAAGATYINPNPSGAAQTKQNNAALSYANPNGY